MSSTIQRNAEPLVPKTTDDVPEFTDWHTMHSNEPTEEQEQAARAKSLDMGNITSVGRPEDNDRTDYYDKLDCHNRDNHWKNRTDVTISESADKQFKRKTLLAFAHQVSLSPLQCQVALTRFLELDLPRCGLRTELIAFAVCAVSLNEDADEYLGEKKPYYPSRNPENNHSAFANLQSLLIERWGAITTSSIQSTYQKVKQRSLPTSYSASPQASLIEEIQHRPSFCPSWAMAQET